MLQMNKKAIAVFLSVALGLTLIGQVPSSAEIKGKKTQLTAPLNIAASVTNASTSSNVKVTWTHVANNSGYVVKVYGISPSALLNTYQIPRSSSGSVSKIISLPTNKSFSLGVQTLGDDKFSNSLESSPKYLFNTTLSLTISAGNNQTAVAGDEVAIPPSVIVKDSHGNPVGGISITFAITSGSGFVNGSTLKTTTTTTNGSGIATLGSWALGTIAGASNNTLTATAKSGSLTGSFVTFTATAIAGAARIMVINGGNGQSAIAGSAVSTAPSVIVKDINGNVVSGFSITFAVATGSGSLAASGIVTTGVGGIATSPTWTLGTTAGTNTETAAATSRALTGPFLTFTATAIAGAASATTSTVSVSPTSITADGTTTATITVQLKDANSNNLTTGGANVTFATPSTGSIATTTDNGDGTYSATYTASTTPGSVTITPQLSAVNFTNTTSITLNVGAASATTSTVSVSPTSITADGTTTATITVQLKDANSNNLTTGGANVTFATPSTGSIATTTDNGDGTYSATYTASTTPGSVTITPQLSAVNFTNTTSITLNVGAASSIAINAGDGQSATVGTAVTTAPSVIVKDSNGNPVGGVSVTFAVASGDGSLGSPATVQTNASGIATSPAWTLGATSGSNTVTATSAGLTGSPLTFTASATAGAGSGTPTSLITNGDFTIQMWVKPTAGFNSTNRNELFAIIAPDTGAYPRLDIWYGDGYTPIWSVYTDSSHSVGLINNTASFPSLGSPAVEGQWHNIVVARHSGRVHIFYDGVDQLAADFDNTQDFTLFTKLIIGQDPSYWTDFTKNGDAHADIYGLRIVDGQDLFLTDFVPSAAPPTAVPGTSFLLSELISPNTDNSLVLNSASYYSYIFGTDTSLVSHGTSPVSTSELPRLTCDPSKICGLGDLGPAGGIVFYHDANGFACGAENVSGVTSPKSISTCHYLEVAPSGWNTTSDPLISWADSANNSRIVTGTQSAIGTGLQNSIDIASIDPDQVPASTAAMAARAYTSIVSASTYADWYLPSQDELNLLCQWNRGIAQNVTVTCTGGTINSGTGAISAGFVENIYWSSTEWDGSNALWQNFAGDTRNGATKSLLLRVRPIRAF